MVSHRTTASTAAEVAEVGRMVAARMTTAAMAAELGIQPRAVLRRVARWRAQEQRTALAREQAEALRAEQAKARELAINELARRIVSLCLRRAGGTDDAGRPIAAHVAQSWIRLAQSWARIVVAAGDPNKAEADDDPLGLNEFIEEAE